MTFLCKKDHNFYLKLLLIFRLLSSNDSIPMWCSALGPFHLLFPVHAFSQDIVSTHLPTPFSSLFKCHLLKQPIHMISNSIPPYCHPLFYEVIDDEILVLCLPVFPHSMTCCAWHRFLFILYASIFPLAFREWHNIHYSIGIINEHRKERNVLTVLSHHKHS